MFMGLAGTRGFDRGLQERVFLGFRSLGFQVYHDA